MAERCTSIEQLNSAMAAGESVGESKLAYGRSESPDLSGYKKLRVWQLAMELATDCYKLSGCFPRSEDHGLTRQLRRAAVSVPLNIAEGWARNSDRDFARFCDIARGSLHEVDAALELAIRLGYLQRAETSTASESFRVIGSMLLKLTNHLRRT